MTHGGLSPHVRSRMGKLPVRARVNMYEPFSFQKSTPFMKTRMPGDLSSSINELFIVHTYRLLLTRTHTRTHTHTLTCFYVVFFTDAAAQGETGTDVITSKLPIEK